MFTESGLMPGSVFFMGGSVLIYRWVLFMNKPKGLHRLGTSKTGCVGRLLLLSARFIGQLSVMSRSLRAVLSGAHDGFRDA